MQGQEVALLRGAAWCSRWTSTLRLSAPLVICSHPPNSYLEVVCCHEAQVQGCICTQCSIGIFLQLALVESCDESLGPGKAEMST